MRGLALLLCVAAAGCGGPGSEPDAGPPVPWTADVQAAADGGNRFALDLYGQLKGEPGNLFVSPYSVHAALGMTAVGAKGTTRDQMVKVLHLPADPEKALAVGDLGRFYAGGGKKPYELAVANALWGQKGFPWRPEFLATTKDRFAAGFQEADFAADPDGERKRINGWVAGQTRDRIKDLLKEGTVTPATTMVLTNAIYFKGKWAEPFDPKETTDQPFHLAGGKTVPVPLMHFKGACRLGVADAGKWGDDGIQLLELPYKGGDLAMVVILPPKKGGLAEVEKGLTAEELAKWLAGLREAKGHDIYLPRCRLEREQAYSLVKPLQALGMVDAFGPADFGGMATTPPGFITAVEHKAFVDVNEEGTEAAAATAVVIGRSARRPFRADRPFLFLIRDVKHGTILFMGRVTNPKG